MLSFHRDRKYFLSPRGGDGQLKSPGMKRFIKEGRMQGEKNLFCYLSMKSE